jgi:hypothetical protein
MGRESCDFSINPFSLPRTKENPQFLFAFFRTLIEGNDQRHRLDFKKERKLWMESSGRPCAVKTYKS